jgi:mannitol/fructose-specific phosphotransferase system IIA component
MLAADHVSLGLESVSRAQAITDAGNHMVSLGLVNPAYVDTMHKRESSIGTFMGNGVAMPHGTLEGKDSVLRTGIVVRQYPDGTPWGDDTVYVVIGLAANSDDHVALLSQLAEVLMDEEICEQLWKTTSVDEVLTTLTPTDE